MSRRLFRVQIDWFDCSIHEPTFGTTISSGTVPVLEGLTEIAQATIVLLRLNADGRVNVRRILMDDGLFFSIEGGE